MRLLIVATAACLVSATSPCVAQDASCKDPKVLSSIPGCTISYCKNSEFDEAELRIKMSGDDRMKKVEGAIESAHYECTGKSALQVSRNAEQALKGAGYTIDFTGYDLPDRYVTAHKGANWVGVVSHEMTDSCAYDVVGIVTGAMTQEMSAAAWADEIGKTGRVAVYGIEFDTAKATLKPVADPVLDQVLALLNAQPTWTLAIEGHTDSTGTKAGNQALSQQRAQAVVAWLCAHGVAAARLSAAGFGDTKPIADNATDEGRARNRRVELVKR